MRRLIIGLDSANVSSGCIHGDLRHALLLILMQSFSS
jgi:hypothetical protein